MSETKMQVKVQVTSYDEGSDAYTVAMPCLVTGDAQQVEVPGCVLPLVIQAYGEPSELVGRDFWVNMP